MKIALVAGEMSGDRLGAGLIPQLREQFPSASFYGVGGPGMVAAGLTSLYPLNALSVMGLMEVVGHLPRLIGLKNALVRRFIQDRIDLFIGIDAPDFNLRLARSLHGRGVRTVHYVSPSVWAWRQGRIKGIAATVDLMLTLFPFEAEFYRRHGVPVCWVGHPLADEIPLSGTPLGGTPLESQAAARHALGLAPQGQLVALLPGSRAAEVARLGEPFMTTARWLLQRHRDWRFVLPVATPDLRPRLIEILRRGGDNLPIALVDGAAQIALAAADGALVASGTAALEAALLRRPLVVAYRTAPATAWLAKRLVKSRYFALPNLLADAPLVPEFFQQQVQPAVLGSALEAQMLDEVHKVKTLAAFGEIHLALRRDASRRAAQAVGELWRS